MIMMILLTTITMIPIVKIVQMRDGTTTGVTPTIMKK